MYFNFKEALQDTKSKLEEATLARNLATEFLREFNENLLKYKRNIFKEIKKIDFYLCDTCFSIAPYAVGIKYTNLKGELKDFEFSTKQRYEKEEGNLIYCGIKEKLKEDGFEIRKSEAKEDFDKIIDSFSIEIK